jgi:hypothetical protein
MSPSVQAARKRQGTGERDVRQAQAKQAAQALKVVHLPSGLQLAGYVSGFD